MLSRKVCVVFGLTVAVVQAVCASETNNTVTLWVPGNANPWLAGMPFGSIAGDGFDVAPDQSPVQVTGIPITSGTILTFSAVGGVSNGYGPLKAADGNDSWIWSRLPGAEDGIADITAPADALIGVFLNDSAPSDSPTSAPLNFGSASKQNFTSLSPELRQPFFIGNGRNSAGYLQEFTVPAGAARLFLGVMDRYEWSDNTGSFTVTVTIPKYP